MNDLKRQCAIGTNDLKVHNFNVKGRRVNKKVEFLANQHPRTLVHCACTGDSLN